jgi:hypothetical protein
MALKFEKAGRIQYTVSSAVGMGSLNHPDDVLLIQYFLTLAAKVAYEAGGMRESPPLGGALLLDGQYGPKTHYWSLYYHAHACDDLALFSQAYFLNHVIGINLVERPMARLMDAAATALGSKEWALLPESPRTPLLLRQALAKKAKAPVK